jgi:hypothetical protein
MKRKIRLTESELVSMIKQILKEEVKNFPSSKSFANVQAFQIQAHEYYYKNVSDFNVISDNPSGCNNNVLSNGLYAQGIKNQCRFKAHPLCGNKDCFQKQAIDGIWGPNTQKVWEEIQDKENPNDPGKNFYQSYTDEWESPNATQNNWQIPAEMENIQLFQYWIWLIIEKDAEKNPSSDEYKSSLCGGQYCTREKAVDGFWGKNTKSLWNEYGQCYLKYFAVASKYSDSYQVLKDSSNNNKESDYGYGTC